MQKHKTLTFTGHRPESLPFGENELSASAIRIKTLLADEIMRCAAQGYDTFLAGGAAAGTFSLRSRCFSSRDWSTPTSG